MFLQNNISLKKIGAVLTISFSSLYVNCSGEGETDYSTAFGRLEAPEVEAIERDFFDIKEAGVLRVITSYSTGAYFLHRGIQVGFEYELLREFAQQNDLVLEVVIPAEGENPYDLLYHGVGDVIAANYTITDERKEIVNFSRPYNLVNQMVVLSEELGITPESISDLKGIPITIRRNSSYYQTLVDLQEQGFDIEIDLVGDEMDTETLILEVANGTYAATVADDNIFDATNKYLGGLIKGPQVSEKDEIAWAIRQNNPDLEAKLNQFLYQHFKYDVNGVPKRSAFLNVLRKKYYEGSPQIAEYFNPESIETSLGSISPYDSLIKVVAEEYDLDWVMLTAITAQESKFDPAAVSWAGAVGLMQVLPRFSEIPEDSLFIPEINVREGARIFADHLDHYAYMDSTNQWQFALATYNSGLGHLADARRLSVDQNQNPNEWDSVSGSLLKLMQRKHYQDARYGFARGIETVRYVNEIMNRYDTYQAILAVAENRDRGLPRVLGIKTLN